jgi:hypothetical protein
MKVLRCTSCTRDYDWGLDTCPHCEESDKVKQLWAEVEVLRELLTYATDRIDGEWGNGNWDRDLEKEYDIATLVRRKLGAPVL